MTGCGDRREHDTRNEAVNQLVAGAVQCAGCSLCCRNSSVFVLSHEVDKLAELNVPMYLAGSVHFIKHNEDGCCPNWVEGCGCGIYADRPLACRVFPFYVIDNGKTQRKWVHFQFCPDGNGIVEKKCGKPGMDVLRSIAEKIEGFITDEDIAEMVIADRVITESGFPDTGADIYVPLFDVREFRRAG
jgi:Fe-S-cluster containining protein